MSSSPAQILWFVQTNSMPKRPLPHDRTRWPNLNWFFLRKPSLFFLLCVVSFVFFKYWILILFSEYFSKYYSLIKYLVLSLFIHSSYKWWWIYQLFFCIIFDVSLLSICISSTWFKQMFCCILYFPGTMIALPLFLIILFQVTHVFLIMHPSWLMMSLTISPLHCFVYFPLLFDYIFYYMFFITVIILWYISIIVLSCKYSFADPIPVSISTPAADVDVETCSNCLSALLCILSISLLFLQSVSFPHAATN